MSKFLITIVWAVVSYFIAKSVQEKEGLDIKPINYSLCSFFFSFVVAMCVLINKVSQKHNNTFGIVITWVVGAFIVILNIMLIFEGIL